MFRLSLLSLLFSSLLYGESLSEEQRVQKGEQVSLMLTQTLGGALKSQLQTGGALKALRFCTLNALSLTDQVGQATDTSIKRISIQNRNPANGVSKEENTMLEQWNMLVKNHKSPPPHVLVKEKEHYTFYKPILINNEVCLKCHGHLEADSELAKEIRSAYPEDKATGYKMGDLRGVIKVVFSD
ncbi:MAG: DUF3365 domain-containing protein [Sulfuricurvum sp.]|nr:DUF3365 domain-containing protein [Sulfuricurvum sp.]